MKPKQAAPIAACIAILIVVFSYITAIKTRINLPSSEETVLQHQPSLSHQTNSTHTQLNANLPVQPETSPNTPSQYTTELPSACQTTTGETSNRTSTIPLPHHTLNPAASHSLYSPPPTLAPPPASPTLALTNAPVIPPGLGRPTSGP